MQKDKGFVVALGFTSLSEIAQGKKKNLHFLTIQTANYKIKITGTWENGRNESIMELLPNLSLLPS